MPLCFMCITLRENRRDRRLRQYQSGKRLCVVVIRERDGVTLPGVFHSEGDVLTFTRRKIARGTEVHADESGAWNPLHGRFIMKRINHQEAYSLNDACTNDAESFFARMRRAEIGHHHHIAGPYLIRFAQEMAWREDHRKIQTASRLTGSWRWRCGTSRVSISAVIGRGQLPPKTNLRLRFLIAGSDALSIL